MTVAQRSRAAATIASKGQVITIVGGTPGTYNPATGQTTPTSYSKTAHAVLLPMGEFRKANNALVKQGDEQMLIAGLDTTGAALPEPPIDSVITLANGGKRTLIAIERLNPEGDGNILYDCIVRGNA